MIKKIGISIVALVVIVSAAFYLLTMPTTFEVEPDGDYVNARTSGIERPFTVDREEYPFASNWFEYEGATMHYLDEGEGVPVVLCHGNPTWSFLYRNVIKGLEGKARFIAHDLPGMGFSEAPEGFDFKPESHSEYVEHFLMKELELDQFIMVVQDWGGPTCLNIATKNPDKVLGIVISNTWVWPPEGSLSQASTILGTPPVQRWIINNNGFGDTLMDNLLPDDLENRQAVLSAYSSPFPTPESRIPTARFPAEINGSAEWVAEIEARMPALQDKPVEFIFGLQDGATTSDYSLNKWKEWFPDAPIQIVEDADHFTQEDTPESYVIAINRLLEKVGNVEIDETTAEDVDETPAG